MTILRPVVILTLCLLLLGFCAGGLRAADSELDDFEHDVTTQDGKPPRQDDHDSKHHHDRDEDDDDYTFVDALARVFGELASVTTRTSIDRVAHPARCRRMGIAPREPGDPLLSMLRFDGDYRAISEDLDALDVRAEAGYGPVAVQFNQANYHESDPVDRLKIVEWYVLWRMSLASDAEIDFGTGQLRLDGDAYTVKPSVTVPVLIHPHGSSLGLEFRPAWADRFSDYDLALMYSQPYTSLKLGYRWVDSPDHTIGGPYLGFSARL